MKKTTWLAPLALIAAPMVAHASLLGSSVTSQYYYNGGVWNSSGSPISFVANGSNQEVFNDGARGFNLKITNSQIIYTVINEVPGSVSNWSPSGTSLSGGGLFIANGNLLTITGVGISNVSLDAATTMTGFKAADLTSNLALGEIAIDWANLPAITGQQVIIDVKSVPEPAMIGLLGLGLAGLGFVRRNRRN